jgi:hypothetical protein
MVRRKTMIVVLCVAGVAFVDFYPSFGQPHFRYRGADPNSHVWNIGWPLAWFIYDPRKAGLMFWPGTVAVGVIQIPYWPHSQSPASRIGSVASGKTMQSATDATA